MDAGSMFNNIKKNTYETYATKQPPPPPPPQAAATAESKSTDNANGNVFFGEQQYTPMVADNSGLETTSSESTLKDIIMQIMMALGMQNPLGASASTQATESDGGYSEGFSMLTKGELEGRIENKEQELDEVDQKLADSTSALETATTDYDAASTGFTEASSAYEQEKSAFISTEAEYLEQHDRYEVLVAARDAKLNGTEMTKEPAYAGNTEEGENDWGYSEGFSMLTVEELDARIEAKEVVLEQVDQEFEAAAESFVAAAGDYESSATEFESASLAFEQAQDNHTGVEAEHAEQHDRFAKLNEALEAKS